MCGYLPEYGFAVKGPGQGLVTRGLVDDLLRLLLLLLPEWIVIRLGTTSTPLPPQKKNILKNSLIISYDIQHYQYNYFYCYFSNN